MKLNQRLLMIVFLLVTALSACSTSDNTENTHSASEVSDVSRGNDSVADNTDADVEDQTDDTAETTTGDINEQAAGTVGTTVTTDAGTLSEAELADLRFMREEEKLAMDVYDALYVIWNSAVIDTISDSETQHVDAMLGLFERYGIADFAADNAPGEFVDANLQALFDQLMTRAEPSLIHALEVGAIIEETDILDIRHAIDRVEGNDDIVTAYENLLRGSRNHLRAFVKNLDSLGYTYEPQFLSQDAYDAIVSSERETGNGR